MKSLDNIWEPLVIIIIKFLSITTYISRLQKRHSKFSMQPKFSLKHFNKHLECNDFQTIVTNFPNTKTLAQQISNHIDNRSFHYSSNLETSGYLVTTTYTNTHTQSSHNRAHIYLSSINTKHWNQLKKFMHAQISLGNK